MAGSIAAVGAIIVSLALKSPDKTMFNSLSVTIASICTGLLAGVLYSVFWGRNQGRILYVGTMIGTFLFIILIAGVIENLIFERFFSFSLPLAAVSMGVSGTLTPMLERTRVSKMWWLTPVAFGIVFAIGFGLVGQGVQNSGELTLPSRPVSSPQTSTVVLTRTPTAVAAQLGITVEPSGMSTRNFSEFCSYTDGNCWVVDEGSEATFTVRERLVRFTLPNDAVVRTEELSGEINLERPSVIEINLHSLSSDQKFRDKYIRDRMFPDSQIATFTVNDLGRLPQEMLSGGEVKGQVTGMLRIRGVVVPLTFDLQVRNDGDVLNVLGRTIFTWDQLQIPMPTARSVLWVEDEVSVEILLLARPKVRTGS